MKAAVAEKNFPGQWKPGKRLTGPGVFLNLVAGWQPSGNRPFRGSNPTEREREREIPICQSIDQSANQGSLNLVSQLILDMLHVYWRVV